MIRQSVFSRVGADRVLEYAFELAKSRPRRKLTVATKRNGIAISMPWWDQRADAMHERYREVLVGPRRIGRTS